MCGGGERRHEGNLADARTQPNNVSFHKKLWRAPPEGSARSFCLREKGAEGGRIAGGQRREAGKSSKEGREKSSCGGRKRI